MEKQRSGTKNRWHAMDAEEAVRLLASNAASGLTRKEAARRYLRRGDPLWRVRRASVFQTLFGESFDFAAILLVITAAVAAVFERGTEAAAVCGILVVSAVLRTATALIAQRIFERSAQENIPRALVIREGNYAYISAEDVVEGDILILSPGDTAVCDARLISGNVDVLEIKLSDERTVVKKTAEHVLREETPPARRSNIVFATSTVVTGQARAVAVAVGAHTYAYARLGAIPVQTEEKVRTGEKLALWCRMASLIMTAAVIAMTLAGLFLGRTNVPLSSLFLSALSLCVASMSEFLAVIASIIMACSMRMLAGKDGSGSIVKQADKIEDIAAAQCVVFGSEKYLQSGDISIGEWYADGTVQSAPQTGSAQAELLRLLQLTALCSGVRGNALSIGDGMEKSSELYRMSQRFLSVYSTKSVSLSHSQRALAYCEQDGLHAVLTPENGAVYAYVCGDLEKILSASDSVMTDGHAHTLTPQMRQQLRVQAEQYARHSIRTAAIAVRNSPYNDFSRFSALCSRMTLIGYYTVHDPVDVNVSRCIEKCRTSGTRLVVLSDNAERARWLCAEAGILKEADPVTEYSASGEKFSSLAQNCRGALIEVHGRRERAETVRELKNLLGITLYVGGSTEDLWAFMEADASAAVFSENGNLPQNVYCAADTLAGGKRENYVSSKKNAPAHDVFRMIGYCRNAFLNLRGAAEVLLLSQVMRLTLMFSAVLFGTVLMEPVQILLWGLLFDYAAVLTFAFRAPGIGILESSAHEAELPSLKNGLIFPCVSGIMSALLIAALPVLASLFGVSLQGSDAAAVQYAGGLFASFAAGCAYMSFRKGGISGVRIHAAQLVYFLLMAALTAFELFTVRPEMSVFFMLFLSAVPALVLLIFFALYKYTGSSIRKS